MILTTEIDTHDQSALIISPKKTVFLQKLEKKLHDMSVATTVRPSMIDSYKEFNIIIFLDYSLIIPSEFKNDTEKKILYVVFGQKNTAMTLSSYSYDHKLTHVKIINIESSIEHFEKDIDTMVWFAFSRTSDTYLHIYHQEKKSHAPKDTQLHVPFFTRIRQPKTLIFVGFLCIFLSQILFLPPLAVSTLYHYKAAKSVINGQSATSDIRLASTSLNFSKRMYQFAQPTYHFLSIALPIEDLLQVNESAQQVLEAQQKLGTDATIFLNGLMLKDRSESEYQQILIARDSIASNILILNEHVQILINKLPEWTKELRKSKESLKKVSQVLRLVQETQPYFDSLFAKDTEKKYLLLFANNMELRPGGGFIGSFAILRMKDYSLQNLEVFDVYDADGQLIAQVDPPDPISKFLNQTHWFLRDSAFSGDFVENFDTAKFFLEKEIGETDFDGGILITTTAVQNLLKSVKSLYIPDFKESITSDNFYIKAQLHAEEDFFPGSKQKKSFLSSVTNQMLFGLEDASLPIVFEELERSLDQKHLVLYSLDPDLQTLFEKNYWSGRILKPTCSLSDALHCIPDYMLPLDANLGVNKANFYTTNHMKLAVDIDSRGAIVNTYSATYTNDSHKGVFPGGTYKNYFQLLMAPNSFIESVKIDGIDIEDYDETNFEFKTIGFLVSIEPQQSKTIQITYSLPTTIVSGNGTYQLILQKQIGSQNSDFQFTFTYPKNMSILRHNLSPLAKDSEIIYNTSISSDKIFLIEFEKK
ncbi:MAG: DUF4012 domain-containing protein [Candidatus Roizmanbacteria bacterium]|nr:DUF4012 domain-containing protein [Candidatus Roizmanbacteria bacterium]